MHRYRNQPRRIQLTDMQAYQFTEFSERAKANVFDFKLNGDQIAKLSADLEDIPTREPDHDGDAKVLDGVTFTHHFVDAPGDYDVVNWHYVTCGQGKPIVFLHGIPDSWYMWHHQMAVLSKDYHCIAVDLKGYGQSSKEMGDYRHEGASEQLFAMLQTIGVDKFFLVGHDRACVQTDFIAANHVENVLGYARTEQHFYHFNPVLAPQFELFRDAAYNHSLDDAKRVVYMAYTSLTRLPVPKEELARIIQEFSYPGIAKAVPRYYNSCSPLQEWYVRRQRLMLAWSCPVMLLQVYDSPSQPREFFEDVEQHMPNTKAVKLKFIPGGHFWPLESPKEATEGIRNMIALAAEYEA